MQNNNQMTDIAAGIEEEINDQFSVAIEDEPVEVKSDIFFYEVVLGSAFGLFLLVTIRNGRLV